jgi:hypothetical protein
MHPFPLNEPVVPLQEYFRRPTGQATFLQKITSRPFQWLSSMLWRFIRLLRYKGFLRSIEGRHVVSIGISLIRRYNAVERLRKKRKL